VLDNKLLAVVGDVDNSSMAIVPVAQGSEPILVHPVAEVEE
jgi:hypothetical protein